eukprot:716855-Pyramimonas_sp.AAC.1
MYSTEERKTIANIREEEATVNAAESENRMRKLRAIMANPFPYTESGQEKVPTSSSFDLPLPSRETPVRSWMRHNFAVPGRALK